MAQKLYKYAEAEKLHLLWLNKELCLAGETTSKELERQEQKGLQNIKQVAIGQRHWAAVNYRGELYTWGTCYSNEMGHGQVSKWELPQIVKSVRNLNLKQIDCGPMSTVMLTESGIVYVIGQLGSQYVPWNDPGVTKDSPYTLNSLINRYITYVICGSHAVIVLTDRGQVYAFDESSELIELPMKVTDTILRISANGDKVFGLALDDVLYSWVPDKYTNSSPLKGYSATEFALPSSAMFAFGISFTANHIALLGSNIDSQVLAESIGRYSTNETPRDQPYFSWDVRASLNTVESHSKKKLGRDQIQILVQALKIPQSRYAIAALTRLSSYSKALRMASRAKIQMITALSNILRRSRHNSLMAVITRMRIESSFAIKPRKVKQMVRSHRRVSPIYKSEAANTISSRLNNTLSPKTLNINRQFFNHSKRSPPRSKKAYLVSSIPIVSKLLATLIFKINLPNLQTALSSIKQTRYFSHKRMYSLQLKRKTGELLFKTLESTMRKFHSSFVFEKLQKNLENARFQARKISEYKSRAIVIFAKIIEILFRKGMDRQLPFIFEKVKQFSAEQKFLADQEQLVRHNTTSVFCKLLSPLFMQVQTRMLQKEFQDIREAMSLHSNKEKAAMFYNRRVVLFTKLTDPILARAIIQAYDSFNRIRKCALEKYEQHVAFMQRSAGFLYRVVNGIVSKKTKDPKHHFVQQLRTLEYPLKYTINRHIIFSMKWRLKTSSEELLQSAFSTWCYFPGNLRNRLAIPKTTLHLYKILLRTLWSGLSRIHCHNLRFSFALIRMKALNRLRSPLLLTFSILERHMLRLKNAAFHKIYRANNWTIGRLSSNSNILGTEDFRTYEQYMKSMSPSGSPIRDNEKTRKLFIATPDDSLADILGPTTRPPRVKKRATKAMQSPTSPKVVISRKGPPVKRVKSAKPKKKKNISVLSPKDSYAKLAATNKFIDMLSESPPQSYVKKAAQRKTIGQVKSQPGSPQYQKLFEFKHSSTWATSPKSQQVPTSPRAQPIRTSPNCSLALEKNVPVQSSRERAVEYAKSLKERTKPAKDSTYLENRYEKQIKDLEAQNAKAHVTLRDTAKLYRETMDDISKNLL